MTGEERPGRTVAVEVVALDEDTATRKHDDVVAEEPLELRLVSGAATHTLAVTMRTPGNDFELAAGFAYDEGIVSSRDAIAGISYCIDPAVDVEQRYNIVNLEVRRELAAADLTRFERHFTMSSACGVCGRAQIDALRNLGIAPVDDAIRVDARTIYALPERMRQAQRVFAATGGLHAAALFDERGQPIAVREDVGRHNALDKLVGWGLIAGRLPFSRSILVASGRASYEIVQKAAMARIPIVCSVSAPSSLAVELARAFDITLVGFLRDARANVYYGDRILR